VRAAAFTAAIGICAPFGAGLANDYGAAVGWEAVGLGFLCASCLLCASLTGGENPRRLVLAAGVMLVAMLAASMTADWPRHGADGLLCGFLIGVGLALVLPVGWDLIGRAARASVSTPRTAFAAACLTTGAFWCGLLDAVTRQAGSGDVLSSARWATLVGLLIGFAALPHALLPGARRGNPCPPWQRPTSSHADRHS
jgi:hypothetical protein